MKITIMEQYKKLKPIEETHMLGYLSIEQIPTGSIVERDFGIQVAEDGRVWICIDGIAFIRFNPNIRGK